MIEGILRLIPPSLLVGLALYAGVSFLWLEPLIEYRLAEKIYLPLCQSHAVAAQEERAAGVRRQSEVATPFRNIAREYLNDLGAVLGQPGLGDDVAQANGPDVPDLKTHIALAETTCGCAVTAAFDAVQMPMLAHVMTARLYTPAALKTLPQSVANIAASGQCGAI